MSHSEWIMSTLTFCYVALTGVYVWYSRKTLTELQRQIGLIEKQDIATQRQLDISQMSAEAARQGVALQKAQLKQWVDIDEWKGHSDHFAPNSIKATYWLSFWITNPTKMPLTLKAANLSIAGNPCLAINKEEFVISPENGYFVEFPMFLIGENMVKLTKGDFAFTLTIDIDFNDVFGEAQHSQFTVACKCWTTRCEVQEYGNRQKF